MQILVPVNDEPYLKKMNDFKSIDALLAYYDTMFETYNELNGLSFTPQKATDKNIPNRYFAKADKSGGGSAYYSGDYTAEKSPSVAEFWLKPGWGGLHEIAHGYQGNFMNDSTFGPGEVWNNIYANTMEQKMLGDNYTKGWLFYGNVPSREGLFEKNVYTKKAPIKTWDLADKLYMLVMMKDKAGNEAFTHFNQAYRAAANEGTLDTNPLLLDLISKYFGETSHYNFTPFIELVAGSMSPKQKEDNLYSGNKAVYPLASLLSDSNLETARNDIKLDTKWGLVSNSQLDKYKLTKTINIQFAINDFEQIKGKTLKIKDDADIVRETKITTPTITLKNMPVGIYSLDVPTGVSRFYEVTSNYLSVSDQTKNAVITLNELKTSTIGLQELQFKGLGDVLFMTANVDIEQGNLKLNVSSTSPHAYFKNEYASIEVLNEQGQSVLKKETNGKLTTVEKLETIIKPGYTIKIMHKEPSRFSITNSPNKLVNTRATEQTFTVTKYGLTNAATGVNAQDALIHFKAKLDNFATNIKNNNALKNTEYSLSKTQLRKGIDYLPEADKLEYQKKYSDLLAIKQNILDGEQFKFQLRGLDEWRFASLSVNLDSKNAIIEQKAGIPNLYFKGTYANIKINDTKGKEIFNKDFNGSDSAIPSVDRVNIAIGNFITIMHKDAQDKRLFITNEQTGENGYQKEQEVTYLVTSSGLEKMRPTEIPIPHLADIIGKKFDFHFLGLGDYNFADLSIDIPTMQFSFTKKTDSPHPYFEDKASYASLQVRDQDGIEVYNYEMIGNKDTEAVLKNIKLEAGYYIILNHLEGKDRLLMSVDKGEKSKLLTQNVYQINENGLDKKTLSDIPIPDSSTKTKLYGSNIDFAFKGISSYHFATMHLDREKNLLQLKVLARTPHSYFSNTYASLEISDAEGKIVYTKNFIGNVLLKAESTDIPIKTGYKIKINHREASKNRFVVTDSETKATYKMQAENEFVVAENCLIVQ
ncbi:putative mucin/carbohydrate-binding domain-containing protein [Listeria ivanovii]|uniref:putative mucin/carbohydrate-binding domain-containing protein n=1 Tax=Listeria ivanovii TaxID=1638 RepID=UPI00281694F1|nr:putative mucin/carbohydrate-binding domain-containing protein [Listeria ivanovii]